MTDISALIVSLNVRDYLAECLDSIPAGAGDAAVEVLVVDNGSTDGTVEMLRERYPQVSLVEMGRNAGFAAATNVAAWKAHGRHLLLLNPDTVVFPGALARLAAFLDSHPAAGVVAPRLLNSDLSDQGTARSFPTPAAALFGRRSLLTRIFPGNPWSRRYLAGRERSGAEPFEIDWVSGACLMVPFSLYLELRGLDEGFAMYWEDADFCARVKRAGRSVHCVPSATVVHHEGKSRRGWPARQQWLFHLSAYRYSAKHQLTGTLSVLRPLAFATLAMRAGMLIAGAAAFHRRSAGVGLSR